MLQRVGLVAVLLSVALGLQACKGGPAPETLIPKEGTYDVTIRRDVWGVPHIYGKTDQDVAYGLAYAHCEDDFKTIQQGFYLARGVLASVEGADAAPLDYMVKLFRFRELVTEQYEEQLSEEMRGICEAFAAGANHYAALNPDEVLAPQHLPVTGQDIIMGFVIKTPMFFGFEKELRKLMAETPQREVSEKQATAWEGNSLSRDLPIGSNTFAVAPHRSDNGSTFLNINSHQPLTGPVAWYEARLKSENGWDMVGGVFPGTPIILHGHNPDLGWAHTVNSPDLIDIYKLEMNPDNPNQYRFDDEWLDLEVDQARLEVRIFGPFTWTVSRELLFSVHGPAIRTEHGVYAIRYAGYGDIRSAEQWYRMNRATNREEFEEAMRMRAIPSFNVGYADKEGNIGYIYNALFPKRAEGYDWEQYLPGNTSETLWTEYLPYEAMPQVWNPESGYIQNCNSSPFQTTNGPGNPDQAKYSDTLGSETHMTNTGLRAMELFSVDESISWEEFVAYKFDTRYSEHSEAIGLREKILAECPDDDPVIKEALEVLRSWDGNTDLENTGAAVAILAMEPVVRAQLFGNPTPDVVEVFQEKAKALHAAHGQVDVPWGEVNRLVRGEVNLPLEGGPDTLRAVYGDWNGEYLEMMAGDCYFILVKWDEDGEVHSETIHQFGSATLDQDSPHYADQAPLFAEMEMRPVWMDEEELLANLHAEYRPGEPRPVPGK